MKIRIDPADVTFSKAIRTRDEWICQRCHTDYKKRNHRGLECSHYFGRGRENIRFDPENCDALCTGCHQVWGSDDKEGYRNFKIKQLGRNGFDKLMLRANTIKKRDRKMELIKAREYLKLMEEKDESIR